MKIDSHQHFWKYDSDRYGWIPDSMANIRRDFLPQDIKPLLQENTIDGSIVVQADQSEQETRLLLDLAEENSFIKGVVGWVDLTSNDVRQQIRKFSGNDQFKGVRHTVWDDKGEFMTNPAFQQGISALEEFGLTYDILAFDYQLPGAVQLVRKFPDQRFVLDHMGKPQISEGPSQEWVRHVKELGRQDNVYCKLSGFLTETVGFSWKIPDFFPFLEVVDEAFGSDRLMFGSDWPVSLAAGAYSDTVEVLENYFEKYNEETVKKVFGLNAIKFYNIKEDVPSGVERPL